MENCDLEIKATKKNPIEMILNYIGETFSYMKITDEQTNKLYNLLSYIYNQASQKEREELIPSLKKDEQTNKLYNLLSYIYNQASQKEGEELIPSLKKDEQEFIEDWKQNYDDPDEMINSLEEYLNFQYEEYKIPTEPEGNTRLW